MSVVKNQTGDFWCCIQFKNLLIHSGAHLYRMTPPTFEVHLPISAESLMNRLHRFSHRFVSLVILDVIQFIIKIKHTASHLPLVIYVIRFTVT